MPSSPAPWTSCARCATRTTSARRAPRDFGNGRKVVVCAHARGNRVESLLEKKRGLRGLYVCVFSELFERERLTRSRAKTPRFFLVLLLLEKAAARARLCARARARRRRALVPREPARRGLGRRRLGGDFGGDFVGGQRHPLLGPRVACPARRSAFPRARRRTMIRVAPLPPVLRCVPRVCARSSGEAAGTIDAGPVEAWTLSISPNDRLIAAFRAASHESSRIRVCSRFYDLGLESSFSAVSPIRIRWRVSRREPL